MMVRLPPSRPGLPSAESGAPPRARPDRGARRPFRPAVWIVLGVCLGVFIAATLPGCSGCRKDTAAKKAEEKKKKKRKPDFDTPLLSVRPSDDASEQLCLVKPGHWAAVSQRWKANNFDFTGELHYATVDRDGRPVDLERMPLRMLMSRPASLPKGQTKRFEMICYVPRQAAPQRASVKLRSRLHARNGRAVWPPIPQIDLTPRMADCEFYFVVLARRPEDYAYLKLLDSVRPPCGDENFSQRDLYYRVMLPSLGRRVPLPANPLTWTSIAYVLWDDADPGSLSPAQQQAMLDWLHWGGQLIVSGPGSLEGLRGSFLADYLPAEPGGPVKLDQKAFEPLNRWNTADGNRPHHRSRLTIVAGQPPEGVKLDAPAERFVPGAGRLLAERRVGRGRIVVTSFSLSERQVINWKDFDGFFNACLLRRPPRRFSVKSPAGFNELHVTWADEAWEAARRDARLVSRLRYFSRDMGRLDDSEREEPARQTPTSDTGRAASRVDDKPWPHKGFRLADQSGVAGWNDFSGVSEAARRALKEAAGIVIPNAAFVLRVLGVYLLVLVPLNWAVFRMIGRVEWAWIAAPLIAVGAALAVVRLAQLDIGFARSRTQISVLELQAGYPRGHLTRYTALYTSLATSYDIEFDDDSALAQPFAADARFTPAVGQLSKTVTFRRDRRVRLRNFRVDANSTGIIHSEQMFDPGGGIRLAGDGRGFRVVNDSDLSLEGVGVVRRVADGRRNWGRIEVAWIGMLRAKTSAPVRFGPVTDARALLHPWEESPATASRPSQGQVSLRELLDLARDPRCLAVGDVRLVGWTDEVLPGMEIHPRASQSQERTLVEADLAHAPLPPPRPDVNTRAEVEADL